MKSIAFASRTLQAHERNYGVTEMEALGVIWAVQQFRHYLYGHKCTVFTDHEALRSLLNTPHPSGKLARWGLALQELDLQIQYSYGLMDSMLSWMTSYSMWNHTRPSVSFPLPQIEKRCFLKCTGAHLVDT